MLEVLPIQSKIEQEAACARCGVTYNENLLAYGASENGEVCGICQFKLSDAGGLVYDIAGVGGEMEFENLFILGRSTLNFIDLCKIQTAHYVGKISKSNEQLIRAIGFKPDENGKYSVDLRGFFNSPCSHDKNKSDKH